MKKLMFAMAVAACAAAVQASTLTYGLGAGAIDTSKINYGEVWAMWANTGTTIDFSSLAIKDSYTIGDFEALGLNRVKSGWDQGTDVHFTASESTLTQARERVMPKGIGATRDGDTEHIADIYIVMLSDNGAAYSDAISTTIETGLFVTPQASAIASSVTVVPEPTSGLLLLLGVAGLALKRKRA